MGGRRKGRVCPSCVAAALVLAVSGFSYFVVRDVSSIGGSHAIASGPSIGAQNILLMGLESRTDWNGNILLNNILNVLHAGSRAGVENGVGGNATNTLILIHIPAGGKKAVGFSIPRRRLGHLPHPLRRAGPGQNRSGLRVRLGRQGVRAQAAELQSEPGSDRLCGQRGPAGPPRSRRCSSSPGRTSTTSPRSTWTGSTSSRTCSAAWRSASTTRSPMTLTRAFTPSRAGYQHLNAVMALAFVRQRHGLLNGGLDRTQPPAGVPRLGHAAAAHRGGAQRPDQDQLAAVGGQAVRDHRRRLGPARLRQPDAQPDQRQPDLPYAAHRGLRDHRRAGREPGRPGPDPAVGAGDVLSGAAHTEFP